MQLLNETQLASDIATLQLLHSRLGRDLSRSMANHTGNFWHIKHLDRKNQIVGNCLDILSAYTLYGDADLTASLNVLSISEIEGIIDFLYREMNEYNVVNYS